MITIDKNQVSVSPNAGDTNSINRVLKAGDKILDETYLLCANDFDPNTFTVGSDYKIKYKSPSLQRKIVVDTGSYSTATKIDYIDITFTGVLFIPIYYVIFKHISATRKILVIKSTVKTRVKDRSPEDIYPIGFFTGAQAGHIGIACIGHKSADLKGSTEVWSYDNIACTGKTANFDKDEWVQFI